MGKVKNLEKKSKVVADFDKNNPESRKKSMNDAKLKKKLKAKDKIEGTGNAETIPKGKKKNKKLKILQQIKKEVEENKSKPETEKTEDSDKLVKREIVKKAIIALKDGINKEVEASDKKNLFDEELRLGLQVIAAKVPDCPPHAKKILLEHSLFDHQPDVCFIIRDSIPKKADQDENIRNFQEKLKEAGITFVKAVIPISKLKQDYKAHNLKLKLCNTYDVFLVECEIAEHVYSILGKHFISKRKRPVQIDTKKENLLKTCVENAVRKVSFKISGNGNMSCFEVGTMKMENVKIADNIMTAIDQLKEKWPGGWRNILRLFLKPMRQSKVTIPIYYSNINPNDVEVPVIKGMKQTRLDKLAQELREKSKKFKLDIKKKKLVKLANLQNAKTVATTVAATVKGSPTKKANKKAKKQKNKDEKGNKKNTEEIKTETTVETEEPVKKKKKKSTATDEEEQPSKKQKKTEEVVEPESEPKKKKKKQQKEVNLEAPETAEEMPALEKKKKSKNKNKSKTDSVDINNDEAAAPIISEKEQISIKKKKKDKKNKA